MPHSKNAGYRKGDNWSTCSVCGFDYRAFEFRRRWDGLMVCRDDWEPRHPQEFLRARPEDTRPRVVSGPKDVFDLMPNYPGCVTITSPEDGSVAAGSTSMTITWLAEPRATFYHVRVFPLGAPMTEPYTTADLTYPVAGLTPGVEYMVMVNAGNENGVGSTGLATSGQGRPNCDGHGVTTAAASTVQFSAPTYASDPAPDTVTITVTRTGANDAACSVNYATSDGTAIAGLNYTATSGTLNWTAGDSASKTFDVSVTEGSLDSGLTINLALSLPVSCTIGAQGTAVVTIPQIAAGALVFRTVDTASVDDIPWTSTHYDYGNWHNPAVNPERFTIPAGVDFVRVLSQASSAGNTPVGADQKKNGATFTGAGRMDGDSGATNHVTLCSAANAVVAGNYFTLDANVFVGPASWFAIEPILSSTKKALYTKSGTQSVTGGSEAAITWQTQAYDNGAWHSGSSSKYIVPAGVTRIQVSAVVEASDSVSQTLVTLKINGTQARGCPAKDQSTDGGERINIASPTLDVTPGDEVEVYVSTPSDGTVAAASWFYIMEAPSHDRALIRLAASQNLVANTPTTILFDTFVSGTAGLFSANGFLIPAGYTQARLSYGFQTPPSGGQTAAIIFMDGGTVPGLPTEHTDTSSTDSISGFGAWLDVVPGNHFTLSGNTQINTTVVDANGLYLHIELR